MRVWDINPRKLCRQHLLGEHREIHAIWSVIVNSRAGYARHPETLRWIGKLRALKIRHDLVAAEIERRKYHHRSPLDPKLATGRKVQDAFVNTIAEQKNILRAKRCDCNV